MTPERYKMLMRHIFFSLQPSKSLNFDGDPCHFETKSKWWVQFSVHVVVMVVGKWVLKIEKYLLFTEQLAICSYNTAFHWTKVVFFPGNWTSQLNASF